MPLTQIHPNAFKAAEIAECAAEQQKFWPMHDQLFKAPKTLDDGVVEGLIADVDVEPLGFSRCLTNGDVRSRIQRDADSARAYGIRGTPAFFIGRINAEAQLVVSRVFMGARPLSDFVDAIEAAQR